MNGVHHGMDRIPDDILVRAIAFASDEAQLARTRMVSRRFRAMAQSPNALAPSQGEYIVESGHTPGSEWYMSGGFTKGPLDLVLAAVGAPLRALCYTELDAYSDNWIEELDRNECCSPPSLQVSGLVTAVYIRTLSLDNVTIDDTVSGFMVGMGLLQTLILKRCIIKLSVSGAGLRMHPSCRLQVLHLEKCKVRHGSLVAWVRGNRPAFQSLEGLILERNTTASTVTVDELQEVLHCTPSLTSLEVSSLDHRVEWGSQTNSKKLPENILLPVADTLINLRLGSDTMMSRCFRFEWVGSLFVGSRLVNLRFLHLCTVDVLTPKFIELVDLCPKLEGLTIFLQPIRRTVFDNPPPRTPIEDYGPLFRHPSLHTLLLHTLLPDQEMNRFVQDARASPRIKNFGVYCATLGSVRRLLQTCCTMPVLENLTVFGSPPSQITYEEFVDCVSGPEIIPLYCSWMCVRVANTAYLDTISALIGERIYVREA
jgi:hypothetical protein